MSFARKVRENSSRIRVFPFLMRPCAIRQGNVLLHCSPRGPRAAFAADFLSRACAIQQGNALLHCSCAGRVQLSLLISLRARVHKKPPDRLIRGEIHAYRLQAENATANRRATSPRRIHCPMNNMRLFLLQSIFLLSSRLYCWFRTFTESAVTKICFHANLLPRVADYTASREFCPPNRQDFAGVTRPRRIFC